MIEEGGVGWFAEISIYGIYSYSYVQLLKLKNSPGSAMISFMQSQRWCFCPSIRLLMKDTFIRWQRRLFYTNPERKVFIVHCLSYVLCKHDNDDMKERKSWRKNETLHSAPVDFHGLPIMLTHSDREKLILGTSNESRKFLLSKSLALKGKNYLEIINFFFVCFFFCLFSSLRPLFLWRTNSQCVVVSSALGYMEKVTKVKSWFFFWLHSLSLSLARFGFCLSLSAWTIRRLHAKVSEKWGKQRAEIGDEQRTKRRAAMTSRTQWEKRKKESKDLQLVVVLLCHYSCYILCFCSMSHFLPAHFYIHVHFV